MRSLRSTWAGPLLVTVILCAASSAYPADQANQTEPKIVSPASAITPFAPPSDAIVLFDGTDLSAWKGNNGAPARWKVESGEMMVNGTGSIFTREEFGDVQLHIEWAAPKEVSGEGQGRGNSGVYLQGRYEIQVLDSYNNKTYPNGQAASFYGHHPPLVNASRKPGEWQVYDIIFHAPKPGPDGKTVIPGSFTVLHNGVLVQDHISVTGDATTAAQFQGATAKGPLLLQDHGNPVRFRNIWLRPL